LDNWIWGNSQYRYQNPKKGLPKDEMREVRRVKTLLALT